MPCVASAVGSGANGGYALLDRTALKFLALCRGLNGADLLGNAIIAVPVVDPRCLVIVLDLLVVCCNHWERLEHLLPLRGEVRALALLPEIVKSMNSSQHPSSRRRGACGGLAGTVRVCLCLSCCLRLLRAFACCAGLDLWMARFGDGALGVAGCNDQLLALVLCFPSVCGASACDMFTGYAEDIWSRRHAIYAACDRSRDLYSTLKEHASLYGLAATQVL